MSPEQRGKGAGKALLIHIAKIATSNNCGRFEWSVLDWNTPSIEFYKALGAREMSQSGDIYRVDGDALQKLWRIKNRWIKGSLLKLRQNKLPIPSQEQF